MKKIMFNDEQELTDLVLTGRKTMTRREAKLPDGLKPDDVWNPVMGIDEQGCVYFTVDCIDGKQRDIYPPYQVGEEVAVAQRYETILKMYPEPQKKYGGDYNNMHWPAAVCRAVNNHKGWANKMYVHADLMPHRIKITNIKMERQNDISDEDCRREGIIHVTWRQWLKQDIGDLSPQQYRDHDLWTLPKYKETFSDPWADDAPAAWAAETPQAAFIVLLSKLTRKQPSVISARNPWDFAFEFELVK